jgi:RNA polymerase sigma-70 factor (ECF subfamily)
VEALVNLDWTAILAANGPRVWRTVYRVLNHHADAEDCFQDTFLTAWKFARDHPVTEWAPYLTWLATHKAIDRLRKRDRSIVRTQGIDGALEPLARPEDPLQDVCLAELLDRLRTALAELPEKQAEVVWLSCVEGLPNQQISEQLEIPPGEVRVLLHRARRRLGDRFAAALDDSQEKQ